MTLDKRSTAILTTLVNEDSYVSITELTKQLNVSRRTIYYDIEKINNWLMDAGLDNVQHVRFAGFILSDKAKKSIPNKLNEMEAWHYEYSPAERKAWLAIYIALGDRKLFLKDLMEKVQVSRNTTIEDMKSLRKELEEFDLNLDVDRREGYIILGEEPEVRKAVVHYLTSVIPNPSWDSLHTSIQIQAAISKDKIPLFDVETIKTVYEWVSESEHQLNLQFTDEMLYSLTLRLMIISKRVELGHVIEMDAMEMEVLVDTKAFRVAKRLCSRLEELYGISFIKDELLFITANLLGAKVNYLDEDFQDQQLAGQLGRVAETMVDNFQRYACILFHDRRLLVKNLMLHLKPAYYRVKYDIEVENRIVESVKEKYEEVFLITKKIIRPFELILGKAVPENEVAYIAIHFGGWLRKEGVKPIARKKALIVCANGIGTSQILKQQLEELFSNIDIKDTLSVREYEENIFDVDFVVSTTSIRNKAHPTFVVSPILTDSEKESLLKMVNIHLNDSKQHNVSIEGLMDVIERHVDIRNRKELSSDLKQYLFRPDIRLQESHKLGLLDFLNEETIQVRDNVADWRQAVTLAAEPLLHNLSITEHYISKMIQNVEEHGPYIVIAPGIAVPHAKLEDGVMKTGMGLLKLNNHVHFSSSPKHDVHFIVVLATTDNESHLKALSQLMELFSKDETIRQLIELDTPKGIYDYFKQSLTK